MVATSSYASELSNAPMPTPRETARWVLSARSIMAVAAATPFLAPWLWVVVTPVSLLVSQHDFIGYRFFTCLAVLSGEARHVDIVQGVPMGILQHVIVEVLTRVLDRPPTDISTLEAFAQASLALALLPGAGILATAWLARRFTLADRFLITLVALVPWFAWPPAPLLLAPDYWPFELLYGLASTVWAVSLLRADPAPHPVGVGRAIVAGAWIAARLETANRALRPQLTPPGPGHRATRPDPGAPWTDSPGFRLTPGAIAPPRWNFSAAPRTIWRGSGSGSLRAG